jgi:hypothetical protein
VNSQQSLSITGNGGGLLAASSTQLVVNNTDFIRNHASIAGGAISAHYIDQSTITNSRFEANRAKNASGIFFTTENTFDPFYLPPWIDPLYSPADVVDVTGRTSFHIKNSKFKGNVASLCGGGVFLLSKSNVSITDSTFRNNIAEYGAGLAAGQKAQVLSEYQFFPAEHQEK